MKEVNIDTSLVYKNPNNNLLMGIAKSKRKNSNLVYDEEFKNVIILSSS